MNNCGNSVLTFPGFNLLWSNPGTFTVSQSIGGCISSTSNATANPLVVPVITLLGIVDPSICGASDASVAIAGSGSVTVSWTGTSSGSTSISLPGSVSGLSAGNYVIEFNDCCASNPLTVNLCSIINKLHSDRPYHLVETKLIPHKTAFSFKF